MNNQFRSMTKETVETSIETVGPKSKLCESSKHEKVNTTKIEV